MLHAHVLSDHVERGALRMGLRGLVDFHGGELLEVTEEGKVLPCIDAVGEQDESTTCVRNQY